MLSSEAHSVRPLESAVGGAREIIAIPTIRFPYVARSVHAYARTINRFGHELPIVVFDNRPRGPSASDLSALHGVARDRRQRLVYVGPQERQCVVDELCGAFPAFSDTIRDALGCHYGGARNLILLYLLGRRFVSVDDDVRPEGMFVDRGGACGPGVVAEGEFVREEDLERIEILQGDVIGAVVGVLGKRVGDLSDDYVRGRSLASSSAPMPLRDVVRLEGTQRVSVEQGGEVSSDARVRVTQTHLTGDVDLEAKTIIEHFVRHGRGEAVEGKVPAKWCLRALRGAIVESNPRLTGAVLGFDNSRGGRFFLPTGLRCEDFTWRLAAEGAAPLTCAVVPAVQTHYRHVNHRLPIAEEWFNEEVSWALARCLSRSLVSASDLSLRFDVREVRVDDEAGQISEEVSAMADAVSRATLSACEAHPRFADALRNLAKRVADSGFTGWLQETVRREVSLADRTGQIWPSIVAYAADRAHRLPAAVLGQ